MEHTRGASEVAEAESRCPEAIFAAEGSARKIEEIWHAILEKRKSVS